MNAAARLPRAPRGALLWLAAALVAGLLLAATGLHLRAAALAELDRARQSAGLAREKASQTRREQQLLPARLEAYGRATRAGLLRGEQRLDWIEHVQEAAGARPLDYLLSPRHAYASLAAGGYAVHGSPMKLTMDLADPQELLDFFARLAQSPPTLFVLEGCRLERRTVADGPGLHAECDIQWLTIAPALEVHR